MTQSSTDLPANPNANPSSPFRRRTITLNLLLIIVLVLGAYLRLVGVNWDQSKHLHPDERFLTMVEGGITPVQSLSEYFDSAKSSLNPENKGFGFFVYGTLPLFIVRYVGEWVGQTGYDQINLVGRQISALADLLTVFLVYLIGSKLYNKRVGVLAAAFGAFAVLQIQLAHYFTVDAMTTLFSTLAFYIAVRLMTDFNGVEFVADPARVTDAEGAVPFNWRAFLPELGMYSLFGLALGMAAASKINAAAIAIVVPAAALIRLSRISVKNRERILVPLIVAVGVAAAVSLVAFRFFQPYTFSGPGFFSGLSPQWIKTMQDLAGQNVGETDAPFALQWARRPVWFAAYNLSAWGLGWPLGILALAGFLWMGWRILKGEWREHSVLWGWTGLYFVWQSVSFTSSMRYLELIYPFLEIIGAWAIIRLWDEGASLRAAGKKWLVLNGRWVMRIAAIAGGVILLATFAWAFAFSRIYTRPLTRVAASTWFYQNIPGALELQVDTTDGEINQQVPIVQNAGIDALHALTITFQPNQTGMITNVDLYRVVAAPANGAVSNLKIELAASPDFNQVIGGGMLSANLIAEGDARGKEYNLALQSPANLKAGSTYYMRFSTPDPGISISLMGVVRVGFLTAKGSYFQALPGLIQMVQPGMDIETQFVAQEDGTLQNLYLPHVLERTGNSGLKTLTVQITPDGADPNQAVSTSIENDFLAGPADVNRDGKAYLVKLSKPLKLTKGMTYRVNFSMSQGQGGLAIYGSNVATESDWDDIIPQPLDYHPDVVATYLSEELNLQLYWPDEPSGYSPAGDAVQYKTTRFDTALDQADVLSISSSRQWGSITRVPERYPLTTAYYRALLGCPADKDILWCYQVAQPGMFQGQLGFDLVYVNQSDPNLGSFKINDQAAEEAFTVYDHPKVFIFRKNADYSQAKVEALINSVDVSRVVHMLPNGKILGGATTTKSLLLPIQKLIQDQAGGTWSQLFNRNALQNYSQVFSLILWYLAVALLGLLAYPLVRLALPGLPDRGYPLARLAGLLIVTYLVWMAGSLNLSVTRLLISATVLVLAIVGGVFAYMQREDLSREWREKRGYFLSIEFLALVVFAIDLLIRLGNPDLWHPSFGGEKPMDFSFFNAVIKSTTFPPYDPWFAGGYINYYYYGFVIFGMLTKWLGIIPSVAYNLTLPTIFMMLGLGAFSLGWNLMGGDRRKTQPALPEEENDPPVDRVEDKLSDATEAVDTPAAFQAELVQPKLSAWQRISRPFNSYAFAIGVAALIGFLILGNLGTVRMLWYGVQKMAAPGGNADGVSAIQHWSWFFQGLPKLIEGTPMSYSTGDWYWIPSRVVTPAAGNEITEFPIFTMLYADPHAHLFAMPITLLVLAWALSIVLAHARWGEKDGRNYWLSFVACFGLGAVAVGALYPTNTWDFYTYLIISAVALAYALGRYYHPLMGERFHIPVWVLKLAAIVMSALILAALGKLLYKPFDTWFGQAYNSLDWWKDNKTPFWSYITHWGLFLFVIVSWMFWETRNWMASTPMNSLTKLRPYRWIIEAFLIAVLIVVVTLLLINVQIAWLALPLAAWALILILRPGQPDSKRFVLFLIGSGLFLTLFVEMAVLKGDIGRQNTIFKFYMQAWTMLSISAAAGLGWMIPEWIGWKPSWRWGWMVALGVLVFGAALYPLMAGQAKITDRMSTQAPHTLDGMAYMAYSRYTTGNDNTPASDMDLKQDYDAIRWMQDNVSGSPVIVEGNQPQYRWGSRFSIYTGLPGVVGWQWHEEQQHAVLQSDVVAQRVAEVAGFYNATDLNQAVAFLQKYNVHYIIVGQLEETIYSNDGLLKFPAQNGVLWNLVYHQANTNIYQVTGALTK